MSHCCVFEPYSFCDSVIPAKLVSPRGHSDLQSQRFKSILDRRNAFSSVGDLEHMQLDFSFILVIKSLPQSMSAMTAPSLSRNYSQNTLFLACFIWAPALQAGIAAAVASSLEAQNTKTKCSVSATDAIKGNFVLFLVSQGTVVFAVMLFCLPYSLSVSGR